MATAQHYKAAEFIRSGIFDNLDSFAELESRINRIPEEKDRGDVFEIFIEAYLATQAITQCVKHWVVGGISLTLRERYNLPADATGIDGIYETHGGTHVAYQVKYRQSPNLTFSEVSQFLGLTERFTDRVIFTNASTLSDKASKRTRWVNRETFLELSTDALAKIEAWLKSKPLPILHFLPNPNYQTQALAEIKAALEKYPCATVVMACGTGKTLVALWAAEQAEPKTVLVLVPSLMLLSQTLREWSEQTSWGSHFSYICVCSDKTVGLKDDIPNIDKSAAGFPIRTDPQIVRQFLDRQTDDIKIVFCTYQSADVVGKAMQPGEAFDFAVFDEAHKTTGQDGSMSSYALADKNLCIRKRLFLTATPRHIDIRHRNKEGDFKVQSMDDAAVYGPRAHTLSFAAAAKKGIICRYKVIISLIDKKMVSDFARKHGITLVKRDEISARWVANLIALKQAVEKVEASKIITFHSRVKMAEEFAASGSHGIAGLLDGYDVRHVNSSQTSVERGDIMRAFADASKSILTNARCLTEGVNIPAVDMVAFIDPKQSRVDIAQAVGRAMRKPHGQTTKTVGYVVVPLFVGMEERGNLEEAVHSEKFDVVVDVLNALQEHDEELVEIIREMKERKGRGEPFNPRRLNEKVQVIGPFVELHQLSASIAVEVRDRIGVSWDEHFGELLAYKNEFEDCDVPREFPQNRELGKWVQHQRSFRRKGKLACDRVERLNSIGFVWDPYEAYWEEMFAALVAFKKEHTHCAVPRTWPENQPLSTWVGTQRGAKKQGKITTDKIHRLEEIGFVWNQRDAAWERMFAALSDYKQKRGDCDVPRNWKENPALNAWLGFQRQLWKKNKLRPERVRRLEQLGVVWQPLDEVWERMFLKLVQYREKQVHPNCLVPKEWPADPELGSWVATQRRFKKRGDLSADRIRRLDELGFVWHTRDANWETMFLALLEFHNKRGDCLVPDDYPENPRLASWVSNQRSRKKTLGDERIRRLAEIGFIWDSREARWQGMFELLRKYRDRFGDCDVPRNWPENPKLSWWVDNQRQFRRQGKLSPDRIRLLDQIGFVWKAEQMK